MGVFEERDTPIKAISQVFNELKSLPSSYLMAKSSAFKVLKRLDSYKDSLEKVFLALC